MSLVWREQMSLHNTLIDTEHQYLIKQINAVEAALNTSENHDLLVETLDHLMEYTKTHFEHEEALQRKINFPDMLNHREEHQKIIKDLKTIKAKLDQLLDEDNDADTGAETDPEITDDEIDDLLSEHLPGHSVSADDLKPLVGLMRSWLVDHIIGKDLTMKPYLEKFPKDFS